MFSYSSRTSSQHGYFSKNSDSLVVSYPSTPSERETVFVMPVETKPHLSLPCNSLWRSTNHRWTFPCFGFKPAYRRGQPIRESGSCGRLNKSLSLLLQVRWNWHLKLLCLHCLLHEWFKSLLKLACDSHWCRFLLLLLLWAWLTPQCLMWLSFFLM